MNLKIFTAAAFWTCFLISLGVAWLNCLSAHAAKSALDFMAKRRPAMISGMRRAENQFPAARRDSEDPAPVFSKQPQTETLELTLIAADPKLYALRMKAFRAEMAIKFAHLYRAIRFSPNQIDGFESLAVQHEETETDIALTANAHGLSSNDAAIATLMKQEADRYQTAQQVLLGNSDYQQLQQLNREQPVMEFVNSIGVDVALTGNPLTDFQADQLSQILSNASSSYQSGGLATQATINWSAALAQAQGILIPVQGIAFQAEAAKRQVEQLSAQFISQEMEVK